MRVKMDKPNGLDQLLVKGTVIIVPPGYYELKNPLYLGDAQLIGTKVKKKSIKALMASCVIWGKKRDGEV